MVTVRSGIQSSVAHARAAWHAGMAGIFASIVAAAAAPAAVAEPRGPVYVVEMNGAIGVASSAHLDRALARARADEARLVVLDLNTPGGLVSSTRTIIQSMLASPIPIVVYVAPGGARAASAGTYIVYAAHVAAMAPGTNIGAATPISLGGVPGVPDTSKKDQSAPRSETTEERKSINDAVAFIRSLAQLRGRNVDWAERAVRDAATLTAEEALRDHVVEIVAPSVEDLLAQLDGRRVTVAGGAQRLATKGAPWVTIEADWWTRLLAVITDPNIAYILLLAGIYGLAFEFISPGAVLPGIVGGISLLLALTALTVLPVNYAGLALILLGIALMIGEAMTPGVIALGIGGVVAFVAGTLFLFEPDKADRTLAVAWPVVAGAAAVSGLFLLLVVGAAIRARRRAVVGGADSLIGSQARVVDWQDHAGRVRLRGELWNARADSMFKPGDAVRIIRREGLKLIVEPDREGTQP
jgi:membrane-bound serine protease (ClpP class)